MSRIGSLRIGNFEFSTDSLNYYYLILFSNSDFKREKFKDNDADIEYERELFITSVKKANERISKFGLTLEKIEGILATLSNCPKEFWVTNRSKVLEDYDNTKSYSMPFEGEDTTDFLKNFGKNFENSSQTDSYLNLIVDPNPTPKHVPTEDEISEETCVDVEEEIVILEEDEGLVDIVNLYRILLALTISDKDEVIFDVSEFDILGNYKSIAELYSDSEKMLIDKILAYTSVFDFILADDKRVQQIFEKMASYDEQKLIDGVILPLLHRMKFLNARSISHHGPGEFGKDILPFFKNNEFGQREYYAVQAKAIEIHSKTSKSQGNAPLIAGQLEVALNHKFYDTDDGTDKHIDKIILITSKTITDEARTHFNDRIGAQNMILLDGYELSRQIVKYGLTSQILSLDE